jgi:adenylyl-sulfate kinase
MSDVTWEPAALSRAERWRALDRRGATVWLTGLPGAGKSTRAGAVEAALVRAGRPAYRLDGDNLRHGICSGLGFSAADRDENVRRAGEIAHLLADSGTIAVVALVSPFADGRRRARELHEQDGLDFIEVFVDTPVSECARRDPKHLYERARAGELTGLTGVDAPYEVPAAPELVLRPGLGLERSVELVLGVLNDRARRAAR